MIIIWDVTRVTVCALAVGARGSSGPVSALSGCVRCTPLSALCHVCGGWRPLCTLCFVILGDSVGLGPRAYFCILICIPAR